MIKEKRKLSLQVSRLICGLILLCASIFIPQTRCLANGLAWTVISTPAVDSPDYQSNIAILGKSTSVVPYLNDRGAFSLMGKNNWNTQNLKIVDLAVADEKSMFLLICSQAGKTPAPGDYSLVFKTTDGGKTWTPKVRQITSSNEILNQIYLSPDYPTSRTLYLTQNNYQIGKSTDEGETFFYLSVADKFIPTAFCALAADSFLVGATGYVVKYTGNQINFVSNLSQDTPVSIVQSSGYVLAGTTSGHVYLSRDGTATFSKIGAEGEPGSQSVTVAFDSRFVENKFTYACTSVNVDPKKSGVYRWKIDSSQRWEQLAVIQGVSSLRMDQNRTMYAASQTVGRSVFRCLDPPDKASDQIWEPVNNSYIAGFEPQYSLLDFEVATNKPDRENNQLFAIVSGAREGDLGYPYRIITFMDAFIKAPVITEPANGSTVELETKLVWASPDPSVSPAYTLQISNSPDFSTEITERSLADQTISINTLSLENLLSGKPFYWRVFTNAGKPLRCPKSSPRSFTVAPTPGQTSATTTVNPTVTTASVTTLPPTTATARVPAPVTTAKPSEITTPSNTEPDFPLKAILIGLGTALGAGVVVFLVRKLVITEGKTPSKPRPPESPRVRAKPPMKERLEEVLKPHTASTIFVSPAKKALARYINLWFTRQNSDGQEIPQERTLAVGETVYLRLQIGAFEKRTILQDAVPFPSQEDIEKAHPELKGQPIPIDIIIYSQDIALLDYERRQSLVLKLGEPTEPRYFAINPLKSGRGSIRLCVFYRNHLLQSLMVSFLATEKEETAAGAQSARVEMVYSVDFGSASEFQDKKLWLGINENTPGTHNLYIKSDNLAGEVPFDQDLNSKIKFAMETARETLKEVSFFKENGLINFDHYRFNADNFPCSSDGSLLTPTEAADRFVQDMAKLAGAGHELYNSVFKAVPPAEQREMIEKRRQEITSQLQQEQSIQITRLKRLEDIWPWALMYDLPVDRLAVKEVCSGFRRNKGEILAFNACHADCLHPELSPEGLEDRVICPFGFWGFKHIIEQPTQPGGKQALTDLSLKIKITDTPTFDMPVASDLIGYVPAHRKMMEETYKFKILDTRSEVYQAFKGTPEPQLIYFFCHGDRDPDGTPLLKIGNQERLLATGMSDWNFQWKDSHPLVFINGCGTVSMQPDDLAAIMAPFVQANASGVIGTEITVYTYLATEFAQYFFKKFLAENQDDGKVGKIIKEIRLELLAKYNPLGLVYTPYCSGDLKIVR